MEASIKSFHRLSWIWDGKIFDDVSRKVSIAFLRRRNSPEILELVAPTSEDSPVFNVLKLQKEIATPYHICYEVKCLEKYMAILKKSGYIPVAMPKAAVALDSRKVAFMLSRAGGLIELLGCPTRSSSQ